MGRPTTKGMDRRGSGRIIDLRVWFEQAPDMKAQLTLTRALRRSDAVLSVEGREVAVALSGTNLLDVERIVIPRLGRTLTRAGHRCSFVLNGRKLGAA